MRPLIVGLLAYLIAGCASIPAPSRPPIHYAYVFFVCAPDQEVAFGPTEEVHEDPSTGDTVTIRRIPVACDNA
jgi:hypothetical protein